MEKAAALPAEGAPPFEPVAHSAFRTLGLAACASQREVGEAASSVRLALKVGVCKSFDSDLAWLGQPARGEPIRERPASGGLDLPADHRSLGSGAVHRRVQAGDSRAEVRHAAVHLPGRVRESRHRRQHVQDLARSDQLRLRNDGNGTRGRASSNCGGASSSRRSSGRDSSRRTCAETSSNW